MINAFEEFRYWYEVKISLFILFLEYRFMKHNLRNVSHITSKLDSGNICPACPQVLKFDPVVSYSKMLF